MSAIKWNVSTKGEVFQKPIVSTKSVDVAGVTKYVINEMYWSKVQPSDDVQFVCLQHVTLERTIGEGKDAKLETQQSVNVVGYAKAAAAMSMQDKITTITANPDVAMALATLLR